MEYVLSKIDTAATATDVTKSVNILIALRWVALAWREVKSITIKKCFRRAGILNPELEVQAVNEDEDPFQDIDVQGKMSSLISRSMGTLSHCSAEEYIDGENSLPTCMDIDGDDWDESWLNSLTEQRPSSTNQDSLSLSLSPSPSLSLSLSPLPLSLSPSLSYCSCSLLSLWLALSNYHKYVLHVCPCPSQASLNHVPSS